jgi:tRNA pseudouridine55 synthase
MRIIDAITPLLVESRLFEDPVKMKQPPQPKKKKNWTHMGLKIGQGGTLDPLADGVLGPSAQANRLGEVVAIAHR